jgi:hypothetical protein
MYTGSVIGGRAEVGEIVCTPSPGMSKLIVSVPGFVFACSIAQRSEPAPLSSVFVTVYTP